MVSLRQAREFAPEISLSAAMLICLWLLYHIARVVVFHVLCGIVFMGVAAWAAVQGQFAAKPLHKAGWFVCTGGTLFLFLYWALTVVFRAPVLKTGIGCGGVKYIHDEL